MNKRDIQLEQRKAEFVVALKKLCDEYQADLGYYMDGDTYGIYDSGLEVAVKLDSNQWRIVSSDHMPIDLEL